jgi:ABC-type transport system involved in cytochrome bd biosynthesis fused ATPase/permease subunit
VASLATALVAAVIGVRLVEGEMTLQLALAVLIVVPEAYMPLRQLGTFYHSSKEGLAAAGTILELIDRAPKPSTSATYCTSPTIDALELSDVTCVYGGRGEGLVVPVTLTLSPGTTTLVCGPSGAGKSTLLRLFVPLMPCTGGTIRVGGIDLRDVDVDHWRRRLGWVAQRPSLFPGTVLDNLRVGAPEVTEAQAASLLARLFPDGALGVSTRLTEDGEGLSGGERVRVAVARAILRSPTLLLLDEPTAFLDARAAFAVIGVLEEASATTTMVVATHEPDRFPWADQILHLDSAGDGRTTRCAVPAWTGSGP